MRAAADVCAINVPPGAVRSIATGPPAGSAPCTVTLVAPSATLTFAANGCGLSTARNGFPPTVAVTVTAAAGVAISPLSNEPDETGVGRREPPLVICVVPPAGRSRRCSTSAEAAVDRLEARHSEWHGHAVAGRVGDLEGRLRRRRPAPRTAVPGGSCAPRCRRTAWPGAPSSTSFARVRAARAADDHGHGASRARSSTRTAPGRPPCRCARRGWPPRPRPARPAAA